MAKINENYLKLQAGYLFPEIGRRVSAFVAANPGKKVIRMGIGDVTRPLVASVTKAFHEGVDEMAHADTFRGYGPEQGYAFLREVIAENDYQKRGIDIPADDILFQTVQNATPGIFRKFSVLTIKLEFAIRFIRFMPTLRLCRAKPMVLTRDTTKELFICPAQRKMDLFLNSRKRHPI